MATTNTTLTTLSTLLKTVYEPGLADWTDYGNPLWDAIEDKMEDKKWISQSVTWGLRKSRPQGIGAVAEDSALMNAKAGGFTTLSTSLKYYYGVGQFTAQAMALAEADAAAFAPAFDDEMDQLKKELMKHIHIAMLYGDGTGCIGQVETEDTANNPDRVVMRTPTSSATGAGNDYVGVNLLSPGMYIDTYASKSSGTISNIVTEHKEISYIDYDAATVYFTEGDITSGIDDDYVFRSMTTSVDDRNKEFVGLGGILDDGTRVATIYGGTRSTNPLLKANIRGNSNTLRAITEDVVNDGITASLQHGIGNPKQLIGFCPYDILNRIQSFLRIDRNYSATATDLLGGYTGIKWAGPNGRSFGIISDRFARPRELSIIDPSMLGIRVGAPLQFEDRTGSIFLPDLDRKHAFEVRLYYWLTMISKAFRCHTTITDLSHVL